MRVIGLDLSLRAPGFFSGDGAVEFHGVFQPVGAGMDRLHSIARHVLSLLPTGVDTNEEVLVLIEGFAYGAKGAALYEIAGLGYIVRYALWARGVRFIEIAPPTLKKFATGRGNVNKNIVIREVYKRWTFNATDDNEADAYVLGRIGLCLAGIEQPATEFQRQIIADLKKKASIAA